MHFVTGGAFNGKKNWVISFYELNKTPHQWHSFYEEQEPPILEISGGIVVLEGIERFVRRLLEQHDAPDRARQAYQCQLSEWLKEADHLVLIATDITKGIVPMNAFDRFFRDTAGWCFQDTAEAAARVDVIWYGIAETIKEETK